MSLINASLEVRPLLRTTRLYEHLETIYTYHHWSIVLVSDPLPFRWLAI